jgi:hypothetical protein
MDRTGACFGSSSDLVARQKAVSALMTWTTSRITLYLSLDETHTLKTRSLEHCAFEPTSPNVDAAEPMECCAIQPMRNTVDQGLTGAKSAIQ